MSLRRFFKVLTNLFTVFLKELFTEIVPTNQRWHFYSGQPVNRKSIRIDSFKGQCGKLVNQSPFQTKVRILGAVLEIAIDRILGKDHGISRIVKGIDFHLNYPNQILRVFYDELLSNRRYFPKISYLPNRRLKALFLTNLNTTYFPNNSGLLAVTIH